MNGEGEASRLLARDHDELDSEWAQILATPATQREVRRERFCGFRDGLLAHIALEEELLFPRLGAADPQARALVARLLEEHRGIQEVLGRLEEDLATDGTHLEALGAALVDVLWEHNAREEGEAYPWFDEHLSTEEILSIRARLAPHAPP